MTSRDKDCFVLSVLLNDWVTLAPGVVTKQSRSYHKPQIMSVSVDTFNTVSTSEELRERKTEAGLCLKLVLQTSVLT